MSLDDYRNTQSWGLAVEAGRILARLRDELPAAEVQGLGVTLQQLVVELPAVIGHDLMTGQDSRQDVFIRLQAALAVVDAVYPALDVAAAEDALGVLMKRAADPAMFVEMVPVPVPVVTEAVEVASVENPAAEAESEGEEASV